MKESYYNYIIEGEKENEGALYVNTRTGSLAHVEEEKHKQFKQYIAEKKEITDSKFFKDLKYCGFLVEDNFDEKKEIKMRLLNSRYDTSVLSLTITPTMACNFRCTYCFESGHYCNGVMTEETEDDICKLVEKESSHLEKLVITWYGGEPLLAIAPLERLTNKLRKVCEKYNIEYLASIITNGYLLTEDICDKLVELGVTDVQITLDGDEKTHNKRRPLANGGHTYETILDNLDKIHGKIGIAIRINVDKENQNEVQNVIDELKEEIFLRTYFVILD